VPNMRAPAMNADDLKAAILELERFHQRFSRRSSTLLDLTNPI